jgi:signal transduction histidine kinase
MFQSGSGTPGNLFEFKPPGLDGCRNVLGAGFMANGQYGRRAAFAHACQSISSSLRRRFQAPCVPPEKSGVQLRADRIHAERLWAIRSQTDRVFAILFALQWIFAVACAWFVSSRMWQGVDVNAALHVPMAIIVGGLLSAGPIAAALTYPGAVGTRFIIAAAQVQYSALLIHLTYGRFEFYFHIFGSLAALALYRDARVFLVATAVVLINHLVSGFVSPHAGPAVWRALELTGWVLFAVLFLAWGCRTATRILRTVAVTQAELEEAKQTVETKVQNRTEELFRRSCELEAEMKRRQLLESQLLQAQKLESIGELAAGIAHEINTPMQFLSDNIEYLRECCDKLFEVVDAYERNLGNTGIHKSWQDRQAELAEIIERNRFSDIREQVPQAISESLEGVKRVIDIVRAMKEFSHQGRDEKVGVDLNNAVRSTIMISRNRWKYVADMESELDPDLPTLRCVPAEINQVLLNLIVNAADAVADKVGDRGDNKGRIIVRTWAETAAIIIEVEDTGCGIPDQIRTRIFDPFFTTKEVGKGTGQGLAICYNIVVNKHQGRIEVDSQPGVGTTFRAYLPINAPNANCTDSDCSATEALASSAAM